MASRSIRSQMLLPSEALLPVNYHALKTSDQLRSHVEKFQRAKTEIALGKRCRRNSISDTRNQVTIAADGPDRRFEDIQTPDSGIRDGLAARFYMPPFPNVQDFTRRSARWGDEEQQSASQDNDSEDCGSCDSTYKAESSSSNSAKRLVPSNKRRATKIESSSNQEAESGERVSCKDFTGSTIIYKCYAKGCKYKHSRRGNFSIHWRRDAKHSGAFDLKKVLHCSQDHQTGSVTTIPYGQVKVQRPRQLSGSLVNIPDKETSAKMSAISNTASARHLKKRKTPAREEVPRRPATHSIAVPASKSETRLREVDTKTGDTQTNLSRANEPRLYCSLECQMFKRLADVPANFPAHLSPLITHGGPDTESPDKHLSDWRYFCPECQKCFTQTHNVASHFFRAHGQKYSKNDRDRTVYCQVTVSRGGVNIDAKPIDETILARLVQIRLQRSQPTPPTAGSEMPLYSTDRDSQKGASFSLRRDRAVPASFLLNTIEAVISERPIHAVSFTTPTGGPQRALPLRRSPERIRRMEDVREVILGGMNAPVLNITNGAEGQSQYSRLAVTTDTPSSTTEGDHSEPDEETATASTSHDDHTATKQPSWQDINQPLPKLDSRKRKRAASTGSDTNRDVPVPEDAEGVCVSDYTPCIVDTKDVENATRALTMMASGDEAEDRMDPEQIVVSLPESEAMLEQSDHVSGADEQEGKVEVETAPTKRRKMTLAEYTALGRGIGALPGKP